MQVFKKFGFSLSAGLLACSCPLMAADEAAPSPATLSFQYSGLKFSQTSSKLSTDSKYRRVNSLMTSDLVDSSIYATINSKLKLSFYPFQDSNALVSIGYSFWDQLELALDLGFNASKAKDPKNEVSSDLIGAQAIWTLPLSGFSLENGLVLDFTRLESTVYSSSSGEDETSKMSSTYLRLASIAVVPIARNAYYMGGLWVAGEQSKDQTQGIKKSGTQLALMLAGLRITLD